MPIVCIASLARYMPTGGIPFSYMFIPLGYPLFAGILSLYKPPFKTGIPTTALNKEHIRDNSTPFLD
jgi:hypothetical protein